MLRLDMHNHLEPPFSHEDASIVTQTVLAALKQANLFGCCLFSPSPLDASGHPVPFEERLTILKRYTEGAEDRIFPVFWLHPDEPDAEKRVIDAKNAGVKALKFICDSYYVYEEKCMKLLRLAAANQLPVIFHSGILWYGSETSKYNRPLNWEALIDIDNLRFSMGHCSWPWHDECIAMYGKFLNHQIGYPNEQACEMFFDLTPGTPPIYRRDLLYKLLNIGYDVKHNLLFGSDSIFPAYNPKWVLGWMQRDDALYREFGLKERDIQRIYWDNILRFLGLSNEKVTHIPPMQNAEIETPLF